MIALKLEIGKRDNKSPSGKIIFNNKIIHNGVYTQDNYEFKPTIGSNTLQVTLENKSPKDTTLVGNKIVADIFVKVLDIKCQITNDSAGHLDTIGKYKTDKEENLQTYGYLSYNGVYTFKFDYPFFIFKKNKIFYQ